MSVLKTHNLTLHRKGAPGLCFPDLDLVAGDRVLILGPSGAGKTSLLSILAGLQKPSSGTVMLGDQDLYTLPARARDKLRGQRCGFVFQALHLLPSLTAAQNITLAAEMAGLPADKAHLEALLARLGLQDKAGRYPKALSQGEQQRVAIARAVFNRPAVIMADEPSAALDDKNAQIVIDMLVRQAAAQDTILLVATHDSRIISHFSKVIRLDDTACPQEQEKAA